jgi:hypothetical protein
MRLFFPHAIKHERRIRFPQMTGKRPAVNVGPRTWIVCFSVSSEPEHEKRRL